MRCSDLVSGLAQAGCRFRINRWLAGGCSDGPAQTEWRGLSFRLITILLLFAEIVDQQQRGGDGAGDGSQDE